MSIYYRNLWVSILLGFPRRREYLYMWFDIMFGTCDYLLSAVGVGHLGSMWLGGSPFSLLPYRSVWDTMAGAFLLAFIFILIMDHWCMVISLLMDVISLLMYGCIMYVRWAHLLIVLVSWIWRGWCISYFHMYILLSLSYPMTCTVDEWEFRINSSRGIQNKCILFMDTRLFIILSSWM